MSVPYYQLQRTTACWCCFCSDQAWSPHGTWYAERRKRRDYIRKLRHHRVKSVLAPVAPPASKPNATRTAHGNNNIDEPLLFHVETDGGFIEVAEGPSSASNAFQVNDDMTEMKALDSTGEDVDNTQANAPCAVTVEAEQNVVRGDSAAGVAPRAVMQLVEPPNGQEIEIASVQSEQNVVQGDSAAGVAVDEVEPLRVREDNVGVNVEPRRSFAFAPPPSQSMT